MAGIGKIVLAGGTGFLGNVLCDYYRKSAGEIVVLSRTPHAPHDNVRYEKWDGRTAGTWTAALEAAGLLVNLSGKNVNCRYTPANMREIYASRLEPTRALAEAVAAAENPPRTWINTASATIYRHAEDRPQDEDTEEIGSGFSVDVCTTWEQTFRQASTRRTKKVILRVGLVLGPHDGVFPRLRNLVRLGMGGHQGNGRQMMSWIHQQDFARIVDWVHHHANDGDVLNATAPEAVTNRQFMRLLRQSYGVPVGLSTPQWLLEAGARLIRTEPELILKSRWVYPKRLLESGFTFQYPTAQSAVAEVLSRRV